MRPTPRTQPYRRGNVQGRMPGQALQAMLQGRQPGQINGADFMRSRLQQMMSRGRPVAGINPPGGTPSGDGMAVDHWGGEPTNTISHVPLPRDEQGQRADLESAAVIRAIQALRAGQPIGAATQARLRSTDESGAHRETGLDPVDLIQASGGENQHTMLMAALQQMMQRRGRSRSAPTDPLRHFLDSAMQGAGSGPLRY